MAPANLSAFSRLVFWARGDGGTCRVMFFADSLGRIPAEVAFQAGPAWQEHEIPFARVPGLDAHGVRAILFSAGTAQGAFRFAIDEIRFR